jgi:hypothetical protein
MRYIVLWLALGLGLGGTVALPRANFLRIVVDRPAHGRVRVIWRPYAGAAGDGYAQQSAVRGRGRFRANADSVARWADESARDSVVREIPAVFTVDMTGGPIVIESVTSDTVHVAVQLTPERGPRVRRWGRRLEVRSDGFAPGITRIR